MSAEAKPQPQPTQQDAFFFLTILSNMKNKPDVDWDIVAAKAGYNNAGTAKTRFGQIKKKLGFIDGASPPKATVAKSRGKKAIGSGTNTTPSKVKKSSPKAKTPKKEIPTYESDEEEEHVKPEHVKPEHVKPEYDADEEEMYHDANDYDENGVDESEDHEDEES